MRGLNSEVRLWATAVLDHADALEPATQARVFALVGMAAIRRGAFEEAYAIMAAQRNSKILGIFVRLNRRDGKPQYMKHLPRIRDYMARALGHEALAPVREFYAGMDVLAEPAA